MSEHANDVVRQVVEDWHRSDGDALDERLDPAYVNRDPTDRDVTHLASHKKWVAAAGSSSPDLSVTIEDLPGEDNRSSNVWSVDASPPPDFVRNLQPASGSPAAPSSATGSTATTSPASSGLTRSGSFRNSPPFHCPPERPRRVETRTSAEKAL